MNTVKVKALVNNMKRERPDLVASFSEHALTEIAKNATFDNSCLAGNIGFLTAKCIALMETSLSLQARTKRSYYRIALSAIANVLLS